MSQSVKIQGFLGRQNKRVIAPHTSSLGCETGRRTVVRLRIAGAAAQPIAGKPARYDSGCATIYVASSLGCETGRRTVVRLRIAGAAAQPIAGKPARYRVRRWPCGQARCALPFAASPIMAIRAWRPGLTVAMRCKHHRIHFPWRRCCVMAGCAGTSSEVPGPTVTGPPTLCNPSPKPAWRRAGDGHPQTVSFP